MKPALIATALFLAGIAPGLWNHGRPVPHSGARHAPPPQAAVMETPPPGGLLFGLIGRRG